MNYSIESPGRGDFSTAIDLAYTRANDNTARALELAKDVPWAWGPSASIEDYINEDPVAHQLAGEVAVFGEGYRDNDYYACFDPIVKELTPDFSTFVFDATARYTAEAQNPAATTQEVAYALDHAKQYSLTLYHAAQYPARTRLLSDAELATVAQFGDIARHLTRSFYLTILGHDAKSIQQELQQAKTIMANEELAAYAATIPSSQFKAQEVDQPLTTLLSALLAVHAHPETELIYALPAGGTQNAVVTQLLYQLRGGTTQPPQLAYLPISTHALKSERQKSPISPTVEKIIQESNPTGKRVLICEDDSTSGNTISLASNLVTAAAPASCNVSVIEVDPRRLSIKNRYPSPEVQIADYHHEDFGTAVGIIPITTGAYPDYQMRKLMPMRRHRPSLQQGVQSEKTATLGYENLDEPFFSAFESVYSDAIVRNTEQYGYASPYQIAATLVRHYTNEGLVHANSPEERFSLIGEIGYAATHYPFLPSALSEKLAQGQEAVDYAPDGAWIREGASEFMNAIRSYAKANRGEVVLLTKGDSTYYANPPHTGAKEQQSRFRLSGLDAKLRAGCSPDRTDPLKFLAHPRKTHLLGTRVLPEFRRKYPEITDLVFVDASDTNLAEAAQQAQRYGYSPHLINPYDQASQRTDLPRLTESVRQKKYGIAVGFIVEMNNVLLHENARAYHQPRNTALGLLQSEYYSMSSERRRG